MGRKGRVKYCPLHKRQSLVLGRARPVFWPVFWLALMVLVLIAGRTTITHAETRVATETRVALVIANAAYADKPLRNARNDGELMAATLRGVGFEVISVFDADADDMRQAAAQFGARIQGPDTVALVYYAGHGFQSQGENYLIPLDVHLKQASQLADDTATHDTLAHRSVANGAVALRDIMAILAGAKTRLNIVILDACRDNPFANSTAIEPTGLAPAVAPSGTFIGYATAPGYIARDGEGANSPYTAALTFNMRRPGTTLEEVFRDTRRAVLAATGGKQVPWEHSSLIRPFYFKEKVALAESSAERADHDGTQGDDMRLAELADWERIKASSDANDFKAHLARYPNGLFNELATFRVSRLAPDGASGPWRWVITSSRSGTDEADAANGSDAVTGSGVLDNGERAAAAFEQAVKLESSAEGREDWDKLAALYREAAEGGVPSAMFAMGRAYDTGRGVERDLAKAAHWYTLAADHGHTAAMASLGMMYEFGEGVDPSLVQALVYYRKAADAGDVIAATSLGYLMAEGKGVARNEKVARKLYGEAAAKGHPRALYNLALMELSGRGGARDVTGAVRHLQAGAAKSHAGSLEELASLYDRGLGVPRDAARAAHFILEAVKAGQSDGRAIDIDRRRWSSATRRELQRLMSSQGLSSATGSVLSTHTRWTLSRMTFP